MPRKIFQSYIEKPKKRRPGVHSKMLQEVKKVGKRSIEDRAENINN